MKEMTESEAADHFYDKWLLAVAKNKRLANDIPENLSGSSDDNLPPYIHFSGQLAVDAYSGVGFNITFYLSTGRYQVYSIGCFDLF